MERLTRPDIDIDQTAVRFMGTEVKIQDISDRLLHLILNGPTINSINKDTLRHLVRQLYTELKRYEELEMTPEAIEQQLTNFSSFLMEMTGGRMSKTNYTVQAMVSEANDHFEGVCDECSDRQELAALKQELAALKQELIDERHRNDRLQDFEVDEAQELAKVKAERDAAMADIQRCCATCALCSKNNGTGVMCPWSFDCNQVDGDHWVWRGFKDTNVPSKEEV